MCYALVFILWLLSVCGYFFCLSIPSFLFFFFFKQKTAYEMRISDWSSDVVSSNLLFDQLSAALAGVIATYAGVIGWISGPLRVGVTIYIILLGFAILRGAVEYPFREFVYRGMKLAALVFAVTTLYGASVGLLAMNGRSEGRCVGKKCVKTGRY